MIFNSVTYIVFLVLVVAVYWILPAKFRLWLLFFAGLVFYGFWKVDYIPLMLFITFTDYAAALLIYRSVSRTQQKYLLVVTLVVNLGLLGYFKYAMFLQANAVALLTLCGIQPVFGPLTILLPLGISFYTFHAISYTIDVYRGFIRPERSPVVMATFVTFFPQLVAGPILRAREIIPQIKNRRIFHLTDVFEGIRRILAGLFLKVVLADNIAPMVNSGYSQPTYTLSALDVWTLAFMFGLQIYFDFSAYSHIAIGSARLMGIRFPENFNYPYQAVSPRDFWLRWHISLSSWVRDYLYLPLTGSKLQDKSTGGLGVATTDGFTKDKIQALFITWALMGFWHGANWTFLFWGLYHASLVFLFRLTNRVNFFSKLWKLPWLGWLVTLPMIMLGWLFFRAEGIEQALSMFVTAFNPFKFNFLGLRETTYVIAAVLTLGMIIVYSIRIHIVPKLQACRTSWILIESITLGVMISLVFIFFRPIAQFIYFQF